MPKYRKIPTEIEAIQLNWKNWDEIKNFTGDMISEKNPGRVSDKCSESCGEKWPFIEISVLTLEGEHIAKHGDFIIKGVNGEFYPCKPDIFRKTYEEA